MRRAALILTLTLALAILLGLTDAVNAQQAADPRVGQLVRTGKLRAGVGVVAPHWAVKDPATGELRGVAVEIVWAWVLTIPASAFVAAIAYWIGIQVF